MDYFDRKVDYNKVLHNFLYDIKHLTDINNSLDVFKENLKASVKNGAIENEHIRPLIWKIMLDNKNWKDKNTYKDIVKKHIELHSNYKSKLKKIYTKKKFNKDPLAASNDVILFILIYIIFYYFI